MKRKPVRRCIFNVMRRGMKKWILKKQNYILFIKLNWKEERATDLT